MSLGRTSWVLVALGAAACSTVLDIQELESDGATGGAAAEGGAGPSASGGRTATGGRATTGGASSGSAGQPGSGGEAGSAEPIGGASSGSGGSANASGGSQSGGEAGSGAAAAGDAGSAGAGGSAPDDATVTGRIIDFWGHPLPNVPVRIGEHEALTDSNGSFSIDSVVPPYDVAFRIGTNGLNHGWLYQGLTRLDPTLQVETALASRSASITFWADNAALDDENLVGLAVGTPDGSYSTTMDTPGLNPFPGWQGPSSTEASVHMLWWARATDAPTLGPERYRAYAQTSVTFTEGVIDEVRLDLTEAALPDRIVQGTVTRSLADYPTSALFVRYPSNAVMELSDDSAAGASFSYTVPELPDAEIVVAASHGDVIRGPYGVAHAVVTGATISLAPPEPVTVLEPAAGATNAGIGTVFRWTGAPGVRLLHIEDIDFHNALFVVTTQDEVTLPELPGFTLRAGGEHVWVVEGHGSADSVDAATGPDGLLDSFSYTRQEPRGPRRGGGAYSFSERRLVTLAP